MNIAILREEFLKIETLHFNIINNYIKAQIKINEISTFSQALTTFKEILYTYDYKEEELLEIAKMKSKIQHFNTEILEDEEILSMAFRNESLHS